METDTSTFLRESNAIEGVYDELSLRRAARAWNYLIKQDMLTIDVVLETHKILMRGKLDVGNLGHFRQCEVSVGGRFGLPFQSVPSEMLMWTFETARENPKVDPVALHVEYEKIHPFVDGNGRTGRMFLNWTRLKRTKEPLLIIYERNRFDYYKWFK